MSNILTLQGEKSHRAHALLCSASKEHEKRGSRGKGETASVKAHISVQGIHIQEWAPQLHERKASVNISLSPQRLYLHTQSHYYCLFLPICVHSVCREHVCYSTHVSFKGQLDGVVPLFTTVRVLELNSVARLTPSAST